jgi:small conductance mechanosensitive channel
MEISVDKMAELVSQGTSMVISYAPKFILALLILFIGLRVIKTITKLIRKNLTGRHVDESLIPFLSSLISWGLKIMLFISVASMFGVETTSFIAVLGAMGLAIGLALQGTLANFAGGVLIMLFKPFKIGDVVEAQGQIGKIKEIQIFNTIFSSPQNRMIMIPNGSIMNGQITNYTGVSHVRVDLTIGISYDANIKQAKDILMGIMENHPKVLKEPAPFVGVAELGDNSVNLAVRPHTLPEDYWDVHFYINEQAKLELDKNDIGIPYPQMDVYIKENAVAQ